MPLIGTTNEEKIWNYLKTNGLSDYGADGCSLTTARKCLKQGAAV